MKNRKVPGCLQTENQLTKFCGDQTMKYYAVIKMAFFEAEIMTRGNALVVQSEKKQNEKLCMKYHRIL